MKNHLMTALLVSSLAVGCTDSPSKIVSADIDSSAKANQKADSLGAWHASEFHPEQLFAKWRKDKTLSSEVCIQLLSKEAETLTLFEEEIKEKANQELVKDCKEALHEKLERYWTIERSKLEVIVPDVKPESKKPGHKSEEVKINSSGLNFKFSPNVQKRDFSDGYYTLTADVAKKEVVLTFDDGPHGQYTDMILRTLAAVDAKVIFFATGNSVRANPEVLKRVAKAGHGIGTHSVSHLCLASNSRCAGSNKGGRLSFAQATAQIAGGHQAVKDVLGWVDPYFRFPFGESDANLKQYLRNNSIGEFYWAIDSNDWRQKSPSQVVSDTMAQIEARGRGVVLFHDIQRKTAEALPTFLKQLYYKGYSVVLLEPMNDRARYESKIVK